TGEGPDRRDKRPAARGPSAPAGPAICAPHSWRNDGRKTDAAPTAADFFDFPTSRPSESTGLSRRDGDPLAQVPTDWHALPRARLSPCRFPSVFGSRVPPPDGAGLALTAVGSR